MEIKSAEFKCSSAACSQCPGGDTPEYAFIGRSNVGKSSLVNMLTGRKSLAKVSGTPGKTRLINHFLINGRWYLVDLPGYGYAKTSKEQRKGFSRLITGYVLGRENLGFLFVLVDSRLEPQKIDLEFISFLDRNGVPYGLVFTKTDKLSSSAAASNVSAYRKRLEELRGASPPIFVSSSEKKTGRDDILGFIENHMAKSAEE